ncbi:hypothetical protein [Psychromonas aquimarina]|uniref:hypothetical protein n=1 Tax=Psychromonas aquimarina TaxID=444919 RepID=UPI0004916C58|nr:hypothetical protein [Psychromonas aquimarina]
MEHQVYFETNIFSDYSLENEQTGKAINLAKWLCKRLPSELSADYLGEDWGCQLFFSEPYASAVEVSCGFVENNAYSIAIKAEQSFFERILGRNKNIENAIQLKDIFDKFLHENSDIYSVEWVNNG